MVQRMSAMVFSNQGHVSNYFRGLRLIIYLTLMIALQDDNNAVLFTVIHEMFGTLKSNGACLCLCV